jgi:hypothetical protein
VLAMASVEVHHVDAQPAQCPPLATDLEAVVEMEASVEDAEMQGYMTELIAWVCAIFFCPCLSSQSIVSVLYCNRAACLCYATGTESRFTLWIGKINIAMFTFVFFGATLWYEQFMCSWPALVCSRYFLA